MTKAILAASTAIVAVLVLTPLAHATPAPTAAGDIPLAEEFWGGPPTQCSSVSLDFAPDQSLAPYAVFGDATEPEPGYYGPCEMALAEVGDIIAGFEVTAELACMAVIHEEGHLRGLGHSTEPGNIMDPNVVVGEAALKAPICVEPEVPVEYVGRWSHPHRRFRRGETLRRSAAVRPSSLTRERRSSQR